MANADLLYQRALDRLSAAGFDALTGRERAIATLWHVEADVNNRGLRGYYAGTGGDLAFHAPAALALVGAERKAELLRSANALFGPDGPPRDRRQRAAIVAALDDTGLATLGKLEQAYLQDPADVDELVERLGLDA